MSYSPNIILLFVILLFLTSCQKEEIEPLNNQPIEKINRSSKRSRKITICHNGSILNVNESALAPHLAHGDVILEDIDGDGFYPDNTCGYGPMGDCDDNNPNINPDAIEICNDGIDNDCDGDLDENDDDCNTVIPFVITSNFDDLNDLGLGIHKGCIPKEKDYGDGYTAGVGGGYGLASVGESCINHGDYVNLLDVAKLTFDISAICDNCINDDSIEEFSIDILNDDGNTKVITIRIDMSNDSWLYNSASAISISYNNPTIITTPVSNIEITDIPSGWTALQLHFQGNYIRGSGDTWAVDNFVFTNM